MATESKAIKTKPIKGKSPAMSTEAYDNRMISLANKCAEEQLRKGTASSQIICHYLKMGSEKEKLAIEKERAELELIRAKTKSIQSQEHMDALFANAIKAMSMYKGESSGGDDEDDEEDVL